MDVNQAKKLYNMIRQYLIFYKEFLEFELKKLDDIKNNRIKLLDEHVKGEEVFLLKSKGFEIKRQEFVKELGFKKDERMIDVIKTAPQDYREKLTLTFEELSGYILDLKETNKRCNTMIELRLHSIKKTISHMEEEKNKLTQGDTKEFVSRKV